MPGGFTSRVPLHFAANPFAVRVFPSRMDQKDRQKLQLTRLPCLHRRSSSRLLRPIKPRALAWRLYRVPTSASRRMAHRASRNGDGVVGREENGGGPPGPASFLVACFPLVVVAAAVDWRGVSTSDRTGRRPCRNNGFFFSLTGAGRSPYTYVSPLFLFKDLSLSRLGLDARLLRLLLSSSSITTVARTCSSSQRREQEETRDSQTEMGNIRGDQGRYISPRR